MLLLKIIKYCLLVGSVVFVVTGCKEEGIDFKGMEEGQRALNERASKEFAAYMSLETMFTDPQVRALAKAAGNGKIGKVEELVAQGVDVNSRGTSNATPLFWSMKNIEGFRKLLELGADPNVVFSGGSVMHWAAMHENTDFLKAAIRHGGDVNLVAGQLEETPIFDALSNRNAVILLLDSGADINIKTKGSTSFTKISSGNTPVMAAATIGRFDIVYELLNRGADYGIKNYNGISLVDRVAARRGVLVPTSDQAKWLEKVVVWLQERGVEIPG